MEYTKTISFLTATFCVAFALCFPIIASSATLSQLALSAKNMKTEGIFGYNEFPSSNFSALPQWQRIVDNFNQINKNFEKCITNPQNCQSDNELALQKLINEQKNSSLIEKIRSVNIFFNQWPYRTDQEVYGFSEYWATPFEFMNNSGDCEDYAIAKFFILRHLGIKNDKMRLITVFDNIRLVGHSVLAIYTDEGKILVLDSLSNGIFEHTLYRHYIPQYSINETSRWLHTAPISLVTNVKKQ